MGRAPAIRIGTSLGKYRLVRVLGEGGMATVYEASHRNGHRVALKVLRPALSVDADVRARFLREGYAANRVDHAGAPRIHDDDVTPDGLAFLVMDLFQGSTLEALAAGAGGTLPVEAVLAVGYHLCDVLGAAHDAGVVHRDVKPANVFVCTSGELKVLDFGIARVVDPTSGSATATGRMLGTPAFMSPEQAYGRRAEIDAKSDLWAAGATIFAVLTGRSVHEASSAEETLVKAATETAPAVTAVMPEVPSVLARVVDRSLARDKADRFEDARAMRQAFHAAYLELFGRPVPDTIEVGRAAGAAVATVATSAIREMRAGSRAKTGAAAALVLAVVAVAAGGWRLARGGTSNDDGRGASRRAGGAVAVSAPQAEAPPSEPARSAAAVGIDPPSASSSAPAAKRVGPLAAAAAGAGPLRVVSAASSPSSPVRPAASLTSGSPACFDYDEEGRKWPKRCR